MLFFSAERLLGTERALLLAGLAVLPGVDRPVIQILDLWRTSHAFGQELLTGACSRIPSRTSAVRFRGLWYFR